MVDKATWLKRHTGRENALYRVLRSYFGEQAERLADAVLQFDTPGPAVVPLVFRPADEHAALMDAVKRPLIITIATGALDTLRDADAVTERRQFDFGDTMIPVPFDLPANVLQSVRQSLRELGEQDYWQAIQAETQTVLTDLLASGIEQGATAERIARRLREEIGGFEARKRARRIARTETTGALNAGHQVAGEELAGHGHTVRKSWSTTRDNARRRTHVAMEGQTVAVGADFDLAGYQTPYPGHHGLPARERINCRCAVFTRVVE